MFLRTASVPKAIAPGAEKVLEVHFSRRLRNDTAPCQYTRAVVTVEKGEGYWSEGNCSGVPWRVRRPVARRSQISVSRISLSQAQSSTCRREHSLNQNGIRWMRCAFQRCVLRPPSTEVLHLAEWFLCLQSYCRSACTQIDSCFA